MLGVPLAVVMFHRQLQRLAVAVSAEHRDQHDVFSALIFKRRGMNHADVNAARLHRNPREFALFHALKQQLFNAVGA